MMYIYPKKYDVIVVGGGHAGVEAAASAARMGAEVLLVTHNIETIGIMSCNPAIGGLGKTHLVKEIDALDGLMGQAADMAAIHRRVLNASKGAAVQAVRYQACRDLYRRAIRTLVDDVKNLTLFQSEVADLIIENDIVLGIKTKQDVGIYAKATILTTGTFLAGTIHVGENSISGGRSGDQASNYLAECLGKTFEMGRLKTGTPPRIARNSIDFSGLATQGSDESVPTMSFLRKERIDNPHLDCHITHTNERTHEIIRKFMHTSPIFQKRGELMGPRYCPSIEQKVDRFPDKESHQIFIEPEGLYSQEIYPNGISTSLPFEAQVEFIRTMKGFENAVITRPGYAISYGYFDPRGLKPSLETKQIRNLFFAGQINGTTGYEEAAAQGLLAGINATKLIREEEPLVLSREESYIGVMIDDLVTNGTIEPYRMFTSRAEYRLLLRCDNAHYRLTGLGYEHGIVSERRYQDMLLDLEARDRALNHLRSERIPAKVKALGVSPEKKLADWVKQPEVDLKTLKTYVDIEDDSAYFQAMTDLRYEGYAKKQQASIKKLKAALDLKIPNGIDYKKIKGLSAEMIEKLERVTPSTLGHASRISGITPAALSIIAIYIKKLS